MQLVRYHSLSDIHINDPVADRVFVELSEFYPKSVSPRQLMNRAGFNFDADPVWCFITLCIAFSRINRALTAHGWQAVRTGGRPDDRYALSPVGG
jgi:hypothetical protein